MQHSTNSAVSFPLKNYNYFCGEPQDFCSGVVHQSNVITRVVWLPFTNHQSRPGSHMTAHSFCELVEVTHFCAELLKKWRIHKHVTGSRKEHFWAMFTLDPGDNNSFVMCCRQCLPKRGGLSRQKLDVELEKSWCAFKFAYDWTKSGQSIKFHAKCFCFLCEPYYVVLFRYTVQPEYNVYVCR